MSGFILFFKGSEPYQNTNMFLPRNIWSFYRPFTPYYKYILDPFLKACLDAEEEEGRKKWMGPERGWAEAGPTAVNGKAARLGINSVHCTPPRIHSLTYSQAKRMERKTHWKGFLSILTVQASGSSTHFLQAGIPGFVIASPVIVDPWQMKLGRD